MGRLVLRGNPPVDVTLRRSAQARRLSLRVSRMDGRATLTLPRHVPETEALSFLHAREDWLRGHLEAVPEVHRVARAMTVPFQGSPLPIARGPVARAVLRDGVLLIPNAGPIGPRVQAFLKLRARDGLAAAVDRYATALGLTYSRLSLRDTRSRWGSCSTRGTLMFSWRLIMAPAEVMNYVAAHEVAHLAEMNHSPAFWAVVTRLYGPYAAPRRWLKTEGSELHRIDFGD